MKGPTFQRIHKRKYRSSDVVRYERARILNEARRTRKSNFLFKWTREMKQLLRSFFGHFLSKATNLDTIGVVVVDLSIVE